MFWMTRVITEQQRKEQEMRVKWAITSKEAIEKYGGVIPMLKEMYNDRDYLTDVHPAIYLLSCVIGELEEKNHKT